MEEEEQEDTAIGPVLHSTSSQRKRKSESLVAKLINVFNTMEESRAKRHEERMERFDRLIAVLEHQQTRHECTQSG